MRHFFLSAATLLALFIGALLASHREAGSSPIAFVDTLRDEEEVQRCVAGDSCTLTGMASSVPGQVAAVAWLDLRTLLVWLGIGADGAHLLMQFLNALAIVLVFHLATQLGGPVAGVAAVWILVFRIGAQAIRLTALYNQQWLLFLGAVFTLACTAVVERPGLASVALAALVAAVLANVHLACLLSGVSVVCVALFVPRRRWLLAAFGALLFALATFAMAPPCWLHDLTSFLGQRGGAAGALVATLPGNDLVLWALFAMGAWAASLASRTPALREYRRRSVGALSVVVPLLAAFLVAPRFGVEANPRYLAHIKAACAIAAALPIALAAGIPLRMFGLQRLVEYILPFVLALSLAVGSAGAPMADDERTATLGDLREIGRILREERGWDIRRMLDNVKAPDSMTALTGLSQLDAAGHAPAAGADDGTSAVLLVLTTDQLPHPLPPTWRVIRRSERAATVLVFMRSLLDWSRFEVCLRSTDGAEPRCEDGGWRLDEQTGAFKVHQPLPDPRVGGTVTLRLSLRTAGAGLSEEIFMPRMQGVCGGQIKSFSGDTFQLDPDRRHARLSISESAPASPSTVELEWHIGSPECSAWPYDGVPFVIEGEAAAVQQLETVLRRAEG